MRGAAFRPRPGARFCALRGSGWMSRDHNSTSHRRRPVSSQNRIAMPRLIETPPRPCLARPRPSGHAGAARDAVPAPRPPLRTRERLGDRRELGLAEAADLAALGTGQQRGQAQPVPRKQRIGLINNHGTIMQRNQSPRPVFCGRKIDFFYRSQAEHPQLPNVFMPQLGEVVSQPPKSLNRHALARTAQSARATSAILAFPGICGMLLIGGVP